MMRHSAAVGERGVRVNRNLRHRLLKTPRSTGAAPETCLLPLHTAQCISPCPCDTFQHFYPPQAALPSPSLSTRHSPTPNAASWLPHVCSRPAQPPALPWTLVVCACCYNRPMHSCPHTNSRLCVVKAIARVPAMEAMYTAGEPGDGGRTCAEIKPFNATGPRGFRTQQGARSHKRSAR